MNEFEALNKILALDNWESELAQRAITVKWSENRDFMLLKYNQLTSNFNDPAVRACRGVIYATAEKPFRCVCAPFIKFGNYGEEYCPEIDWTTARVLAKMDGSLMKAWNYQGIWHLSTNGMIDAYEAEITDYLSFGKHFEDILGEPFACWAKRTLNPNYTYMFELTSLANRVVIEYTNPKIWFLARRNIETLEEDYVNDTGLERPKQFDMTKLSDCLAVAAQMTKDEEGMVVNDHQFNRIKIKSPEYLMAAHLVNNRAITTKRIIRMIQDLTIDDFLAYCADYSDKVESVQGAIAKAASRWNHCWDLVARYAGEPGDRAARKIFAEKIRPYVDAISFLFYKYDHRDATAEEYLLNMSVSALKKLVERELN